MEEGREITVRVSGTITVKIEMPSGGKLSWVSTPENREEDVSLEGLFEKLDESVAELLAGVPDSTAAPEETKDAEASSEEANESVSVEVGVKDTANLTREEAVDIALRKLKDSNPGVVVRRGGRSEGDIVLEKDGAKIGKIKVYYSKTYTQFNNISWYGVQESKLAAFPFHLFIVNDLKRKELFFLLFSREELTGILEDVKPDNTGKKHISFRREEVDGRIYLARGEERRDVTFALNNLRFPELNNC